MDSGGTARHEPHQYPWGYKHIQGAVPALATGSVLGTGVHGPHLTFGVRGYWGNDPWWFRHLHMR
jgi:hypothetical protein